GARHLALFAADPPRHGPAEARADDPEAGRAPAGQKVDGAAEVLDLAADRDVLEDAPRYADIGEIEQQTRVAAGGELRGQRLMLRALLARLHAVTEHDDRTRGEI